MPQATFWCPSANPGVRLCPAKRKRKPGINTIVFLVMDCAYWVSRARCSRFARYLRANFGMGELFFGAVWGLGHTRFPLRTKRNNGKGVDA